MKTLTLIILAVIFPLMAMPQAQNLKLIKLKTLDNKSVELGDIIQENNATIIYFFNERCKNLTDQFDYLESLAEEYSGTKLKIIAIYNTSTSNYAQVKPFIRGNDINLETLIDVNGELQRALGLPVNSPIILTSYTSILSGNYKQTVSYSP